MTKCQAKISGSLKLTIMEEIEKKMAKNGQGNGRKIEEKLKR